MNTTRTKDPTARCRTAGMCTALLLLLLGGCSAGTHRPDGAALSQAVDRIEQQRLADRQRTASYPAWSQLRQPTSAGQADVLCDYFHFTDYPTLVSEMPAEPSLDPSAQHARPIRAPLPSLGQTILRDLKQMPAQIWTDTKRTYSNRTNAIILLTAGGASLALRCQYDDKIEDKFDRARTFNSEWGDLGGAISNPGTHFALAGLWYLVGAAQQDLKTYQVGKTLFSALIINNLSTMALKAAANTDSPNGEPLAWPSGHTSSMVCFAAVMDQAYGHWVGWPLYGLAGFGAFTRLDDREHHLSDIVFGAALGWVIGHTVATGHEPEIFGGKILPYADPVNATAGLMWAKSFK